MAKAVIMPKFEMAQETGTVSRWLKNEGDSVKKGESILEVETDKVIMEVESPATGTLVNITAPAGLVVPIGQPIAYILAPGEQLAQPAAAAAGAPAAAQASQMPPAPANAVPARATPLAERVASAHGIDLAKVTGTGPQGRVMREDVESALAERDAQPDDAGRSKAGLWPDGKVRAVPAARRTARELGVDLLQVAGSGPEGRIQTADVVAAAGSRGAEERRGGWVEEQGSRGVQEPLGQGPDDRVEETDASTPLPLYPSTPLPLRPSAPPPLCSPSVRRTVPLTSVRRTIAERMAASVREAPQFAVGLDADMGRAQSMVDDLRVAGSQDGSKVTLTAFLVKACAWALAQYPAANASFDPAGQIVEWADINVGVATAADQGLVVPVIHGADNLGLRAIAARLADLAARARENRLRLEDIQGGTFTVSNLGMFGIERFEAILNPPQAAILAAGRVTKRPVVGPDDQIRVCPMCSLTLTADHRVLDGAGAARFLQLIQQALEHPGVLVG